MNPTDCTTLTADDRLAIESLLTEFYWRLDHADARNVAELFIEAGTLVTPRFSLSGSEAIAQWFVGRSVAGARVTRHAWSNPRLTSNDEGSVTVAALLRTAAAPLVPEQGGAELMIGETEDRVVQCDSRDWRFASRRLTVVFEGHLSPNGGHA